jgi:hypothetical protein
VAAGERDIDGICDSWLSYRKENAAAMLAYGMWLELRRGDVSGAEECYRIAVEHGRQKTHLITRSPFSQNCRQWFEAKDRVWIQARALSRLGVLLHSVHNKSEAAEAAWNEAHRVDPQYVGKNFSKVLYIVTIYRKYKYASALTFESVRQTKVFFFLFFFKTFV